MAKYDLTMPKEVSTKYALVNWTGSPNQNFGRFGQVNLSKMTIEKAERLLKAGFPKLKQKKVKAAPVEAEKK